MYLHVVEIQEADSTTNDDSDTTIVYSDSDSEPMLVFEVDTSDNELN